MQHLQLYTQKHMSYFMVIKIIPGYISSKYWKLYELHSNVLHYELCRNFTFRFYSNYLRNAANNFPC